MSHLIRPPTLAVLILASLVLTLGVSPPAFAQIDPADTYYVPEAGPVAVPVVGAGAIRFFRGCPNNDGNSWGNSARIRIHVEDVVTGLPIAGIPAASIYMKFNGGPAACVPPPPGLPGADEIIANDIVNFAEGCPLLQYLFADGPTDAAGDAYITFMGASAVPGVGERDPRRKWGHYDDIPVYVIDPVTLAETAITGRLTTASLPGTYTLQLKNVDFNLGVNCLANQGETVTSSEYNTMVNNAGEPAIGINFWRDLDWSGTIAAPDFNIMVAHFFHDCNTPLDP